MLKRWILILASAPSAAYAGGIFVGDAGSQGSQRAGAFVAKADDPMAILYNPAGLVKVAKRYGVYLGANLLNFSQSFDRYGTYEPHDGDEQPAYVGDEYPKVENQSGPLPVPTFGAAQRFGRFAIGEGFFAPQAFPNRDYDDTVTTPGSTAADPAPAPGRYDILEQNVIFAFPSFAGAVRILDELDVGARVSWGFGKIHGRNFVWGITNDEENIHKDGDFAIDVSDNFMFAYGFGALYRPIPAVEIGAAYSGPVEFRGKGTGVSVLGSELVNPFDGTNDYIEPVLDQYAQCAPGGTVAELKACLDLNLPQIASLGARYIFRDNAGRERGDVELDVRWEDWSEAQNLDITVDGQSHATGLYLNPTVIKHGFEDTFAVRLGGAYRFDLGSPFGGAATGVVLRGGVSYDTAAAPTSWTRIDMDGAARLAFALGFAYELPNWRFDIGGQLVSSPDAHVQDVAIADSDDVDNRVQPDPIQPLQGTGNQVYSPFNAGEYERSYLIGSLGVTAWW